MIQIEIAVQRADFLLPEILGRIEHPGPGLAGFPEIMRRGAGSFAEAIEARSYLGPGGLVRPWDEPDYAKGKPIPPRVAQLEAVIFAAVLGEGAGAITEVTDSSVTVGVDDLVIREIAASQGNQIVSTANYAGFVLGDFARRQEAALAFPVKPSKLGAATTVTKKGRPLALAAAKAMPIFIGLNYHEWLKSEVYQAGILTPPKNIGPNDTMIGRLRRWLVEFFIGRGPITQGAG